ncbi:TrmB family transcriptional regulator [Halorarum halobium]|uniref:TrmB family transcriptional regulator n=1 Tax=Halorarum halobium TaxID=3075121 RepID=UPI0028ABD76C|nr:helix-turn-helix domain-containing protein [Halobaculum sp. XH14]
MAPDSTDEPRSVVLEQLEAFGLSAYAVRTFAALVSLGDGTAQDVSDVADVPRTRVYDAVEELRTRRLVDVQQSTPKRFWPISSETAGRQFDREYSYRVDALVAALDELEPITRSEEQRGVWTVTGRRTVSDRVVEFIESAEE